MANAPLAQERALKANIFARLSNCVVGKLSGEGEARIASDGLSRDQYPPAWMLRRLENRPSSPRFIDLPGNVIIIVPLGVSEKHRLPFREDREPWPNSAVDGLIAEG